MKKVILSVAAVFAFGFANAQETVSEGFTNGDVFISGAVGFESSKTGDAKTNVFEVAPSVGFFVTPNIAVGGRVGFTSQKQEEPLEDEIKTTTFTIGAFGRYYFTPASKFSFFGELAVNYGNSKREVETPLGDIESKSDGFGVQVAPGVSYFLSKNIAIEATWGVLGYNTVKPDADGAESTDTFEFGLNLRDINFGIVYKF